MKHKSYLLFVFFVAAWLGIIFLFSAQPWPNSFHTSSAVEQKIISFAAQFAGGEAVAEQLRSCSRCERSPTLPSI